MFNMFIYIYNLYYTYFKKNTEICFFIYITIIAVSMVIALFYFKIPRNVVDDFISWVIITLMASTACIIFVEVVDDLYDDIKPAGVILILFIAYAYSSFHLEYILKVSEEIKTFQVKYDDDMKPYYIDENERRELDSIGYSKCREVKETKKYYISGADVAVRTDLECSELLPNDEVIELFKKSNI